MSKSRIAMIDGYEVSRHLSAAYPQKITGRIGPLPTAPAPRQRAPSSLGYLPVINAEFMTPDAVTNYLNQVNGEIIRLNNDIQASEKTKTGEFRNNWHSFVVEWQTFYNNMINSWTSRAWTANIDTLRDYNNNKVPAWEKAFLALGGTIAGPGAGTGRKTEQDKPGGMEWLKDVKWIAIAGLGIAGLIYLGPMLKKGR